MYGMEESTDRRSSLRFRTDAATLLGYIDVLVKQGNKKGAGMRLMDARLFLHEATDVDNEVREQVSLQIDDMSRKVREMEHTFRPIG